MLDVNTQMLIVIAGGVINGAITWGVISVKLQWLRRDLDELQYRIDALEGRPPRRRRGASDDT
jgi:hypothetical protein